MKRRGFASWLALGGHVGPVGFHGPHGSFGSLGSLGSLGSVLALSASSPAVAAEPLQQAECIAGARAGGGFDLSCKLAQAMLAAQRPLQLRYMPGGIGAVAYTTIVNKRPADAQAIVAFSSGSLLNLAQGKFGPYTEADVRWLAVVGTDYGVIAVRKDSRFRSLQDVLQALKADPRAVAFGAGGTIGSQDWFKAALLARAAGVSHKLMRFVAFEGGGEAMVALEGGHVDLMTGDVAEVSQRLSITSGSSSSSSGSGNAGLRLLAVLADKRLPGLHANVPTAREQGVDLVWPTARGFYLGPKVSDEAFRDWTDSLRKAMAAPDYAQQRAAFGLYPLSLTGDELQAFIRDSMARYRALAAEFALPKR